MLDRKLCVLPFEGDFTLGCYEGLRKVSTISVRELVSTCLVSCAAGRTFRRIPGPKGSVEKEYFRIRVEIKFQARLPQMGSAVSAGLDVLSLTSCQLS
jgi:hypothetical protein